MKLKNLVFITLFIVLFTGCGKDDPDTQAPVPIDKEPEAIIPTISSLSKEYLFMGDELVINGANFIQIDFETKVFVNNKLIAPSSLSSTEIKLMLEPEEEGPSEIVVEVDGKLSESAFIYVLKKGWNKLVLDRNREFKKAVVLEEEDDIYVLGDLISGSGSSNRLFKISPSPEKFISTQVPNIMNGSISNFEIDSMTGNAAVSNGYSLQLFENKFETEKNIYEAAAVQDPGSGLYMRILLDENQVFYSNLMYTYGYSSDFGTTYKKQYTDWLLNEGMRGAQYYGSIRSIKKAPSDGKIYGIGVYRKRWKYDEPDTNLIMRSDDYQNWEVIDSVTVNTARTLYRGNFFDTDLILTIDSENNLLRSSDLAKTWSTVGSGIKRFYIRSRDEWYAVSTENQVISTLDAGQTWTTELEFEETDIISHINFSKSKIVVSGYGFLYIKHE
ncbi:hypothetical protein BUL40_04940 [Croceivirga radicis]|uniref:IPT/TIG domain-containing protein n=1 Tax=Croceivirga radicis TaxID=1929488 RepID=A0A1V6LSU9_9FLAO|nr:IPT/TIG domain-containing protein [Croceivirga radicis]OQD43189.1 hypothetical protein BUL40_04940 [Croceivirga radicis]